MPFWSPFSCGFPVNWENTDVGASCPDTVFYMVITCWIVFRKNCLFLLYRQRLFNPTPFTITTKSPLHLLGSWHVKVIGKNKTVTLCVSPMNNWLLSCSWVCPSAGASCTAAGNPSTRRDASFTLRSARMLCHRLSFSRTLVSTRTSSGPFPTSKEKTTSEAAGAESNGT